MTYKLQKGLSVLTLFQYFRDLVSQNNLARLAILVLILFAIGYAFGYPIGISANIHYLQDDEQKSIGSALSEGIKDFFSVFELNALAFSFGAYTYFSTLFRLYILDILNSGIVVGLMSIWGICVLFSGIFWQYAKYILVLEKKEDKKIGVSEALRKSMSLTISNFGITIKGFLAKVRTTLLFYFKIAIVITIPLLIIYFLATNETFVANNQRVIWVIGVLTMIMATFLLTSTQAFFFKFRYGLYKEVKNN